MVRVSNNIIDITLQQTLYTYYITIKAMGRLKGSTVTKSETIVKLEQELRDARKKERNAGKVAGAREYLQQYEDQYERSKTIFFGVNGARRVLKNA